MGYRFLYDTPNLRERMREVMTNTPTNEPADGGVDAEVAELVQLVADMAEAGTTETNHEVITIGMVRYKKLLDSLTRRLTDHRADDVVMVSREQLDDAVYLSLNSIRNEEDDAIFLDDVQESGWPNILRELSEQIAARLFPLAGGPT